LTKDEQERDREGPMLSRLPPASMGRACPIWAGVSQSVEARINPPKTSLFCFSLPLVRAALRFLTSDQTYSGWTDRSL